MPHCFPRRGEKPMNDNLNWYSYRKLAEALQQKYPDTDTLDLSDETLGEMLYGLDMTKGFPTMPEKDKKDIFFAVAVFFINGAVSMSAKVIGNHYVAIFV